MSARWIDQRDGDGSHAKAARCVRWLGPDRPCGRVREADARAMVRAMREAGLGPASINRHLSALRAVLDEGGAAEIPMPWQREPRGRQRWLSRAEVDQLRQAALPRCPRVASLIAFLAETGMRVGEALGLAWADVQGEWATVRRSKNGDSRRVPLTPEARASLTPNSLAGPFAKLSQSRVNHVFRHAREQVASTRGDLEVVPHCLRHTAASRLVEAGVSLPVVAAWLGHRDFKSTLRYTHVSADGLAAAARLLQR